MNNITKIGMDCVGCRSCEQSCPAKCISIIENDEGFLYPVVNEKECIECSICLKKCPVNGQNNNKREPIDVYALKEIDIQDVFDSASGGAANIAAKTVLGKGGVVYGAAYDENLRVHHIEVNDNLGLKKIQSSKYVQSDLEDSYSNIKKHLEMERVVLFTGTPCQIAGLYSFLGKDYESLYTLDLICHGVPSPKLLAKYIKYQEQKKGEKILSLNFRSKKKRGWGTQYLLELRTSSRNYTKVFSLDKFGKHFKAGDCYRECCYNCRYANLNRLADLTVGDFWGIDKSYPHFSSSLGVSSVLVNSEKGKTLINWMSSEAEMISCKLEEAMVKQGNLRRPTQRPLDRDTFYIGIQQDNYFDKIKVGLQLKERAKSLLPRQAIAALKRVLK